MKSFKEFLIEYNAPSQFGVITSDLISPVISGQGGGADVTVMNPKGAAFNTTTKPTLGMGFEMAPNLTGQLQKFVNKYSYKNTNSVNKVIDSKNPVTWQTTNQAVSNQQKEVLDKLLVKHNLKSDTPPPSPEHEEWEEYDRWLEKQLEEWERLNPPPVRTDDMTQEEWDILFEDWMFERGLYTDSQEQWYLKNTGRENLPRPDPKPRPRPRAPTWSPKPWWAGEIPPNNPNWWHWGPDGSDTVMGMNNNLPQLLSQGRPQNNPGYKPPYQNPDGTWQSPFPQDWQPNWELSPDMTPPPVVFNPADPSNPPTYDEWLRQHPEPKDTGDPDIDFQKLWDAWEKAWKAAQRWYNEEQRRRKERKYYSQPGVGVGRGINDFTREILPDFLNPFGN